MQRFTPLVLLVAMAGCAVDPKERIPKINGVNWTGTYAAPVLDAELNMEDVTEFVEDLAGTGTYPDKLIYFEYKSEKISASATDYFNISDSKGTADFTLTADAQTELANGSTTLVYEFTAPVSLSGTSVLDSMRFAQGNLVVTMNNEIPHDAQLSISLPDVYPAAATQINVPWTGNKWTRNVNISLAGRTVGIRQIGGVSNLVQVRIQATFNKTGGNPIDGIQKFRCEASLQNPRFEWLEGQMDNWNILLHSDSFRLGIFTNATTKGKLLFNDARFKYRFRHNLTSTVTGELSSLAFTMQNGSKRIVGGLPKTLVIPASDNPNRHVSDSFYLNASNSQVATIVEEAPKSAAWKGSAVKPSGKHRVYAVSNVEIYSALELPFSGTVKSFTLRDTSDFDLGISKKELGYIDWINVKLYVENAIPMAGGVQLFFQDNAGRTIDSLLTPYRLLLPAANIDASGNVTSAYKERYDIRLEKEKINRISDAVKVITRIEFPSAQLNGISIPVRVTSDNRIRVKLGIESKGTVNERF